MHAILVAVLIVFALWLLLGVLRGITLIGQPRKPLTPAAAASTAVVGLSVIAVLVWAAAVVATA